MPVERDAAAPAGAPDPAGRVLTRPLLAFLLVVAASVAAGLWHKYPAPDSRGTAALLHDGDLDGAERQRHLARLVELADAAPTDTVAQWFGALAAVRLEDRTSLERLTARLVAARADVARAVAGVDLSLGDPLLANVAAAWLAELAGDQAGARRHWEQVAEQCRLQGRPLAAGLAAAALAKGR